MERFENMKNTNENETQVRQGASPAETETASNEAKKYDLLKEHIDAFRQSYDIDGEYNKNDKELDENGKRILFDKIICNYYEILIGAFKKLAKYNKKYTGELIAVYAEMWKMSPRVKDRDYFTPYLYDLCKFLFENKEFGKLTFFYNLMIFSREIPFLAYNEEMESYLRDAHLQMGEEDPFEEFRRKKKENVSGGFDINSFNELYERFFQILKLWKERTEGYYSKDEIFFMTGLFILDELIDLFYINNEEKLLEVKDFESIDGDRSIYNSIYNEKIYNELMLYYDSALKYLKKATAYNPNNPRYFYEYARCLKNSGKSNEAEIFFKKAFDLNTNEKKDAP